MESIEISIIKRFKKLFSAHPSHSDHGVPAKDYLAAGVLGKNDYNSAKTWSHNFILVIREAVAKFWFHCY